MIVAAFFKKNKAYPREFKSDWKAVRAAGLQQHKTACFTLEFGFKFGFNFVVAISLHE